MSPDTLATTLRDAGLDPKRDHPVARLGFWRLGGPADVFVDISTPAQLATVMTLRVPVTVIGKGSNLLVADAGIRGLTIRLVGDFRQVQLGEDADHGPVADVGGGVMNTVLLKRLADAKRGGAATLAGVPGTMGGAIRMNAGTHLGEIGDRVVHVDLVLPGGRRTRLGPEELSFSYRWASLPLGAIVTSARLRTLHNPTEVATEQDAMAAHLARRKATQPLDQPSCGSVFKNPPDDHAGRLIEEAGLKGAVQGGAQISPKHANFIVNTGEATARDVRDLVKLARDTVETRFGVTLEPEVHAVGDWPATLWPL